MLQIPELLAPAGDLERLRYAINYGADAVYCALPEFGMRSAPTNFTPEQLTEGVIYAHARELAELASQLEKNGSHTAYEQVMAAVSDFEKGNLRLSAVLASLKG